MSAGCSASIRIWRVIVRYPRGKIVADPSLYLEKPWSVVEHDGRVSICSPRAVITEIIPSQLPGVVPHLPHLSDRLAIAEAIARCFNAQTL